MIEAGQHQSDLSKSLSGDGIMHVCNSQTQRTAPGLCCMLRFLTDLVIVQYGPLKVECPCHNDRQTNLSFAGLSLRHHGGCWNVMSCMHVEGSNFVMHSSAFLCC
jgi:hypothetical protein